MKRSVQLLLVWALFLSVSIVLLRSLLVQAGIIGFRSDWIFPLFRTQAVNQVLNDMYILHPNVGQVMNSYYAFDAIFASLGVILGIELASKTILLIILLLSGFSSYCLSRTLLLEKVSSTIAGFFYMTTPVIFNEFRIGHVTYLFSYAVAPFAIALFIKATAGKKIDFTILIGAGLAYALSWVQLQFSVMVFIVALLYSIIVPIGHSKIRSLFVLFSVFCIAVALHIPWILPTLTSSPVDFKVIATSGYLVHLSPTLIDALRLKGYVIASFEQVLAGSGAIPFSVYSVASLILLILVFLPILIRRNRVIIFFSFLTVVTLFFAKGVNPPFGSVYLWLQDHFSIMSSFREIYHVDFVLALSYGVLIGFAFQELPLIVKRSTWLQPKFRRFKYPKAILGIILISIICVSSWPVFTGDFAGTVQTYEPSKNLEDASSYLSGLGGAFKVAWLPMSSALYYQDSKFDDTTRDPMMIYSTQPAIDADSKTYQTYYAFLQRLLETNRTSYLSEMLSYAGVKYVIARENVHSRYSNVWNQTALLDGQSNFALVEQYGNVSIFENTNFKSVVSPSDNLSLAVGDLSLLNSLQYLDVFEKENSQNVFFVGQQQQPSTNAGFLTSLTNNILFESNSFYDYVLSFLPTQFRYDPADYTSQYWPYNGWAPYFYNWGINPEEVNSLNQGVITVANDTFSIPFSTQSNNSYEIWAKIYSGEQGGALNFSVDGSSMELITNSPYSDGMQWVKIGPLEVTSGQHSLEITSEGGLNIVDVIYIMPSDACDSSLLLARNALQDKGITLVGEFEKMGGNMFLRPAQQWGDSTSDGAALESLAPTAFTGALIIPRSGNYSLDIRTNDVASLSDLKLNGESYPVSTAGLDSGTKVIDAFDSVDGWVASDANVSLSTEHPPSNGVSSLNFSFTISKSENENHVIYKTYPDINVTSYNKIGFWVYPDTQTHYPTSEVFFHMQNSAGNWTGTNLYLKNDQWNYVNVDLPAWKGESNLTLVRFLVGDQWGTYDDQQEISLYINGLTLFQDTTQAGFKWTDLSNAYLNEGNNTISFNVNKPGVGLDSIALESISNNPQDPNANAAYASTTCERINPTKYSLHVNASKPFYLILSDLYQRDWVAYIDWQQVASENHFLANSFANGWYINKTGTYTVTLEFKPQRLFDIGLVVSITTVVALFLILVFLSRIRIKRLYLRLTRKTIHEFDK